ncbi:substrate-binding periplasmic protein [Algicola sagamiensis]|uniref:substrate-binding periplasmic protein n=1 Tax=Algicola sagamiensis TaxID=163869 RepID=UPI00037DDAFC|nr:transporter substrate-binding domain-containing protein [Algicola sagamiensis]
MNTMRVLYNRLFQLNIIVAFMMSFSWAVHAADTVVLTNGEWPPFLGKTIPKHGSSSDIVVQAFDKVGIKVKFEFYPWKRAIVYVENGEKDGSLVWQKNPEREKLLYFSDPVLVSKEVFFHLKGIGFSWKTYDDIAAKKLKVGAAIGYSYSEEFANAEKSKKINVKRVTKDLQNLQLLLGGRIDVAVINEFVGYEILRKNFKPEEIEKVTHYKDVPVNVSSYSLILSKKIPANKERIEKFNQGLKQLKDAGIVDKIMQATIAGEYSAK